MKKMIRVLGVAMGVGIVASLLVVVVSAANPWLGGTDAATARATLGLGSSATVNAVSTNTASTVVKRDASGDFAAGTITATLTGNVTGNVTGNTSGSSGSCTGNAATATAAATSVVVDTTAASCYVAVFEAATGSLAIKSDAGLTYNASTGMLTATGLTGPLTGTASNATLAATVTAADSSSASCYVGLFEAASGSLACKTDTGITYDATTGMLTATGLTGPLTGNASSSTLASTVTAADTSSASCYLGMFEAASGSLACKTDTGATYDATTGTLTVTAVASALTGNVTGNVSGSSGSCTGNAATATLASTVTAADTADATCYLALFESAEGSLGCKTDTGATYAADTGTLTVTAVASNLTGNVTGNCSGTSANVTGTVAIANGGTGAATAPLARVALSAAGVGSGTLVDMPLNSLSALGDIYIDTGAGDAYISCSAAADTTGWKKISP